MILLACVLYFCITLIMLFALYSGYRFFFGEKHSGTKWGIWCLLFGVASYFIFHAIANHILTPVVVRQYLFLFLIMIFMAISLYNEITTKEKNTDENTQDDSSEDIKGDSAEDTKSDSAEDTKSDSAEDTKSDSGKNTEIINDKE